MAEQQMSEEQIKALQEKIKSMSPEELKEFQKKQCIFCQIISGKVQSRKIYEDENVFAIIDINPANPGHLLVMPREHYSIMPQIPEEDVEQLFLTAKMLSNAMLRALEVQGTNVIVANGVAAGQRAQHFMLHLIPRKENDALEFEVPQKNIPEKELQSIAEKLAHNLGMKKEKPQVPLFQVPKRQVVEAEFKEEPKAKQAQKKQAKPEKTHSMEKDESKSVPKKHNSNLDDIARLLGAK